MGGAHSEREDFAKSARGDVTDPFHNFFFGGGGGGGKLERLEGKLPPAPHWIEP